MDYAVIGGGLSGLSVAYELTKKGISCEVFEKSRVAGGRLSSRLYEGCLIDHGAPYFTVKTPEFAAFLKEIGAAEQMLPLAAPVVSCPWENLDDALRAAARETTDRVNSGVEFPHRYYLRDGMAAIGKLAAEKMRTGSINLECYVEGMTWNESTREWILHTRGDNTTLGGQVTAKRVILALPAPQGAQLLQRSGVDHPILAALAEKMDQVSYHPCVTVVAGVGYSSLMRGVGALQSEDPEFPMRWISWVERVTPTHIPDGHGVLLTHLAPEFSRQLIEYSDGEILSAVCGTLQDFLNISLPTLWWMLVKRWRFADPAEIWNSNDLLDAAAAAGVFACGDFLSRGRVESAFLTGYRLAAKLT